MKNILKEAEKTLSKNLLAMRKRAVLPKKRNPSRSFFAKRLGVHVETVRSYETNKTRVLYINALALQSLYEGRKNIDPLGEDLKVKLAELEAKLNDAQTTLAEGMVLLQTCRDPGYPHGMNDDDVPS